MSLTATNYMVTKKTSLNQAILECYLDLTHYHKKSSVDMHFKQFNHYNHHHHYHVHYHHTKTFSSHVTGRSIFYF